MLLRRSQVDLVTGQVRCIPIGTCDMRTTVYMSQVRPACSESKPEIRETQIEEESISFYGVGLNDLTCFWLLHLRVKSLIQKLSDRNKLCSIPALTILQCTILWRWEICLYDFLQDIRILKRFKKEITWWPKKSEELKLENWLMIALEHSKGCTCTTNARPNTRLWCSMLYDRRNHCNKTRFI